LRFGAFNDFQFGCLTVSVSTLSGTSCAKLQGQMKGEPSTGLVLVMFWGAAACIQILDDN
jgi:hypothetical protein